MNYICSLVNGNIPFDEFIGEYALSRWSSVGDIHWNNAFGGILSPLSLSVSLPPVSPLFLFLTLTAMCFLAVINLTDFLHQALCYAIFALEQTQQWTEIIGNLRKIDIFFNLQPLDIFVLGMEKWLIYIVTWINNLFNFNSLLSIRANIQEYQCFHALTKLSLCSSPSIHFSLHFLALGSLLL